MRRLHRRVASQLRCNTGMRRFAFDFHHRRRAAFAPHHQTIRGAARFEVEGHVVGLGGFLDQVGGNVRAGFFTGIEQEGDLRVVLEIEVFQDFQRVDSGDDAALVVHHARPVGAAVLDVERPLGGRAFLEHGVHVRHQQDFRLAGAFESRDYVAAFVRCVGHQFDGGAEFFQLVDGDVAHLCQAGFIAGTGVDVHQPLQQFQGFTLVLLGIGEDVFVGFGEGCRGECAEGEGHGKAGGQQGTREIERHESILVSCRGGGAKTPYLTTAQGSRPNATYTNLRPMITGGSEPLQALRPGRAVRDGVCRLCGRSRGCGRWSWLRRVPGRHR